MNNRIVTEPAFKIREIARNALAGKWSRMYTGILIYFIMLSGMMTLLDCFFLTVIPVLLPNGQYINVPIGYASWLYEIAVGGALLYGLSMFMLAFLRKRETDCGLLFDGFGIFRKTFILYLLYSIKIFLWSLLFYIPGIVASYRYSQAFYLQVDNPTWSASQCINESKALMMGNKGKLFYLNLTFIGWYFLANFPAAIAEQFAPDGIVKIVLWFITAIPIIAVDLYNIMSKTVFYELVTENLVVLKNNREGEF